MKETKITNRKISIIVGILILTAYLMLLGEVTHFKPFIFLLDLVSGLSVIGISVLMYSLFKSYGKQTSRVYITFKIIEGLLMIIAGVLFLFDSTAYLRVQIYGDLHTTIFIVGAFLFYYLLYVSKLVPKFISIWGFIAISCLLLVTVLKLLRIDVSMLEFLLILIITNELFLSIWLFVKGFNRISA